jgi:hypothetical protein
MKKIILGTAQFGLKYGINNLEDRVKPSEVKSILDYAIVNGFDLIDTAVSYGQCEKILGKIGVNNFKIISKLPKVPKSIIDISAWVREQTVASINRLGVNSLYGLLLHYPLDLIGPQGGILIKALRDLKTSGLVLKVGVSIYDPKELDSIFSLLKIDIVQSPLNIVDRRLVTSGWLSRLKNEQIEVHVRSVFLQGLLLMQRNKIPSKFERWSSIWDKWISMLDESRLNAVTACLSYPLSLPDVDCIIVGADNTAQLKDIILASKTKTAKQDWSFMVSNDQMLINPSNWSDL